MDTVVCITGKTRQNAKHAIDEVVNWDGDVSQEQNDENYENDENGVRGVSWGWVSRCWAPVRFRPWGFCGDAGGFRGIPGDSDGFPGDSA